jgi:TonB family protein
VNNPALERPAVAPSSTPISGPAALAAQRAAEQEAIDRAASERSERSERERLAAENEARNAAAIADQSRRASELRLNQVHQYVQLAEQRIASGALVDPADDSARYYVGEAFDLAPDDRDVRAVSMAFGDALIAAFRRSLAAGDRPGAARWLQASRDYQITDATLNQMRVQLDGFEAAQAAQASASRAVAGVAPEPVIAQEPQAVAASVAAPVGAPLAAPVAAPPVAAPVAVTAPTPAATPPVSASRAVAAVAGIIPESKLHRQHFVAPIYPATALALGRTGTVEMDFTVTPEGTVTDIDVTSSEPAGTFDHASMLALSHSRYEPVKRDGVAVAQRAHIRMRFAL